LEWLDLHRRLGTVPNPEIQKEIANKVQALSRCLPEPVKAHEFLTKFSNHLRFEILYDIQTNAHLICSF